MRILLLSLTARGHAVADALSRSPQRPEIISVSPKRNPALATIATEIYEEDLLDFDALLSIAKKTRPDFAFVAPDDPIGAGIVDALASIDIPCVAPSKSLARIESSKGFARDLLKKYGIDASPKFKVFRNSDTKSLNTFIVQELEGNYVVKYDALKGGKGVKVSGEHLQSPEEGVAYAKECIEECGAVVIEEKLIGVEFSLMSFVSGETVVDMPAVQDHKRAFEGDAGPNTGGMGTVSDADHSLPFLQKKDLDRAKEINRLVAAALKKECGADFKGILYGGFIAVKDGIRVIEYNARFGDPEALNVLPLLSSDFVTICQSIIDGTLSDDLVTFANKATVCKYITPDCYPGSKDRIGAQVSVPDATPETRVYLGDVQQDPDGTLRLGGSRAAGIVGIGETIADAERSAQSLCEAFVGPVRFRSDIGSQALLDQRSKFLRELRT